MFEERTTYYFESVGKQGVIAKVIQFLSIARPDLAKFIDAPVYNLGFGDLDLSTMYIDDLAESRNGDKDKVLATVAGVTLDFIDTYPDVVVYATGSTPSRTRQYQMGLNRFYGEITLEHTLYGRDVTLDSPS